MMGRHSRSRQTWTHHAIGGWTSLRDTVASGAGLGLILPMLTSPCCTSGVKHQRLNNFDFIWDYVAIDGGGGGSRSRQTLTHHVHAIGGWASLCDTVSSGATWADVAYADTQAPLAAFMGHFRAYWCYQC